MSCYYLRAVIYFSNCGQGGKTVCFGPGADAWNSTVTFHSQKTIRFNSTPHFRSSSVAPNNPPLPTNTIIRNYFHSLEADTHSAANGVWIGSKGLEELKVVSFVVSWLVGWLRIFFSGKGWRWGLFAWWVHNHLIISIINITLMLSFFFLGLTFDDQTHFDPCNFLHYTVRLI
jgi:hypothetical protein